MEEYERLKREYNPTEPEDIKKRVIKYLKVLNFFKEND